MCYNTRNSNPLQHYEGLNVKFKAGYLTIYIYIATYSYLMLVNIWHNTKVCTKILVRKAFHITNTITKLLHYFNDMFPAYYAACMTAFQAYYVAGMYTKC